MTDQDVERLLQNPSIIRNRAKIRATVDNARAMKSASPSLPTLAKSDDYKGRDVCTCGFVHSVGSSPDRGLGGVHRNVLHNVFVTEVASDASDDVGARAIVRGRARRSPGDRAVNARLGSDQLHVKSGDRLECFQGFLRRFRGNGLEERP